MKGKISKIPSLTHYLFQISLVKGHSKENKFLKEICKKKCLKYSISCYPHDMKHKNIIKISKSFDLQLKDESNYITLNLTFARPRRIPLSTISSNNKN